MITTDENCVFEGDVKRGKRTNSKEKEDDLSNDSILIKCTRALA